jgi:hypothetical protein
VALVVIASTSPSTAAAKSLAATLGPIRLGLGLVNRQGASPQFRSVKRRDSFVGFTGIRHFDKRKAPRASRFPVRHDADFFDFSVRLEGGA